MADPDRAEVPPVHLGLLARQGVHPQIRLRARRGTYATHVAAYDDDAARVATSAHHLVQARSAKTRMLLEGLDDQWLVRVEDRRTLTSTAPGLEPMCLERVRDRVVMKTERDRDRADLPVLREEETTDLRPLLTRDHRRLPIASES